MRIAHLSDPHVPPLPAPRPSELFGKRVLSYLSWRLRRQHILRREVLDVIAAEVVRAAPDHIVVTGDLTSLGLPAEFDQARTWLRSLGSGETVSVIPGNHDALVNVAWTRSLALWSDYMTTELDGEPPRPLADTGDFPWVRTRGDVAVVGVSSAVPTPPLFASGRIGARQLERLRTALLELGRKGLFRLVLLHHSPVPGALSRRKGLMDAAAFRRVLADAGAELILCGHDHKGLSSEIEGPNGAISVIGAPAASALPDPRHHRVSAGFNVFEIDRRSDGWCVTVERRSCEDGSGRIIGTAERPVAIPPGQWSVAP